MDDVTYWINEGSFALPSGLIDRTTNIFVPANTEVQPNLNVSRDNAEADEDVAAYVNRQLAIMKQKLPGYQMRQRNAVQLGQGDSAVPGEQVEAQYKNGGRPVFMRQAAFLLPAGTKVLVFSASSPKPLGAAFDAEWATLLASFVPRVIEAAEPGGDNPGPST
ncbi:DUF1795 domain-containing protein [Aquabacterium sp. A7-Y]|uniref:DUF1795 domain-containing protein n=1 Tax=Aquabacterium sp. A7-Y TaxID=1349605 RepID=UPI00223DB97B|nr:DUF1795 domain-containing protein [Aquabacterium sp. A7-Y]MCW7540924.1 DUF1795 domain-containing protein [Aquabacterium sp. A7-Y]